MKMEMVKDILQLDLQMVKNFLQPEVQMAKDILQLEVRMVRMAAIHQAVHPILISHSIQPIQMVCRHLNNKMSQSMETEMGMMVHRGRKANICHHQTIQVYHHQLHRTHISRQAKQIPDLLNEIGIEADDLFEIREKSRHLPNVFIKQNERS